MVYLIIFFAGYGAILEIPIGNITIMIPCVIETTEVLPFGISLVTMLDIIITSPFAMVMFYLIYRSLVVQPIPKEVAPSETKKGSIKILIYGACISFIIGVIMHAVANGLNGIQGNPVPTSTSGWLEIAIYYFDEVLGHKLIHIGIFAFLIGGMVLQFWHRTDPQLSKLDKFGVYFWPSAIGAVYMLTVVEGQAGFDVLVISLALIAVILYFIKFRGLKLSENVFMHFILVLAVAFVVAAIVYGLITGFKPSYPFFYQLNELS